MKKYAVSLMLVLIITSASSALAQTPDAAKSTGASAAKGSIPAPPAITDKTTPVELARAALMALGGENFKKLRGFRIVDAEGNTTDFYIDPGTAQVSEYVIPYNGYTFGSSISKFRESDGVMIPTNFTQRFELPGAGAYFAEYKVKDIKLNQPVGDDVFVIQ